MEAKESKFLEFVEKRVRQEFAKAWLDCILYGRGYVLMPVSLTASRDRGHRRTTTVQFPSAPGVSPKEPSPADEAI